MKPEIFSDMLKKMSDAEYELLGVKGALYSRNNDRLSNFKRVARILDIAPEKALLGFALKHIVNIFDMIDDVSADKPVNMPAFEESVGDVRNYLALLMGLLRDRMEAAKEVKRDTTILRLLQGDNLLIKEAKSAAGPGQLVIRYDDGHEEELPETMTTQFFKERIGINRSVEDGNSYSSIIKREGLDK